MSKQNKQGHPNGYIKAIENIAKRELVKKLISGKRATNGVFSIGKYVYKIKTAKYGKGGIYNLDDELQQKVRNEIGIVVSKAQKIYDNRLRTYRARTQRVMESPKAAALIEKHTELPMTRIIQLAVVSGKIQTTYEDLIFLDMLVSLICKKPFDFDDLYPTETVKTTPD